MQQQIWEEEQAQSLPELDELLQQQVPKAEEPEQDIISQHYEQDFDPVEQSLNEQLDPQIKEELSQPEQPRVLRQVDASSQQPQKDEQEHRLMEECRSMQSQIAYFQAEIKKYQQKEKEEEQPKQNTQDFYQTLLQMKKQNDEELQKHKLQFNSTISGRFGKDAFSLQYLLQDREELQGKMLEEKLMEQILRINALLHCTTTEIGKLRLAVKRNGDGLENADDQKDQLHLKYRELYREAETKKEKIQNGEQKIKHLDEKIEDIHVKMSQLHKDKGDQLIELNNQKRIARQYEELNKLKQTQLKRISIIKNSCHNSITSLSRLISDLRKQTQELQLQLSQVQRKNSQLQQKSTELLSSYQHHKPQQRYRYQSNVNHFAQPQGQLEPIRSPSLNQNKINISRKRNYSIQRKTRPNNSHLNLNFSVDSNNPYMGLTGQALDAELSANDSVLNELENKLRQCSTDGVLRKQFKLKLPNNSSALGSRKYIDAHANTAKEIHYRKIMAKREHSKLSVSERIEKIQSLQKQDKIHAFKASRVVTNKQRPTLSLHEPALQTNLDLVTDEPNRESSSLKKNVSQKDAIDKSKTNLIKTTTELELSSGNSANSPHRKRQLVYPELQLPTPQHLFSSIKQKLTMRESSALGSFKVDNSDISAEYIQSFCNESPIGGSRLRHSTFMKKRSSTVREKKLTDDYMRMLEEKGRRILELDSEYDG